MELKEIISVNLILIMLLSTPAYAQLGSQSFQHVNFSDNNVTQAKLDAAESSFSDPGILPDHPFYFLKIAKENLQLFFAFNETQKADLHLEMAKTRLAEAKKLIEENKTDIGQKQLERFNEELDKFDNSTRGIGGNISSFDENDTETLEKSRLVLELVLQKAPEEAKPAIEHAINNSIEKKVIIETENETSDHAVNNTELVKEKIQKEIERSNEIKQHINELTTQITREKHSED